MALRSEGCDILSLGGVVSAFVRLTRCQPGRFPCFFLARAFLVGFYGGYGF